MLGLLLAAVGGSGSSWAATAQVQRRCGVAGVTMHSISGAQWPEPAPPCHYRFLLRGVSVAFAAQEVAPRQPDGLFGPPNSMFTVPAAAPPGEYRVRVELHLDSGGLLAAAEVPFFVVRVDRIEFERLVDGALLLGENPAALGGGQRIFVGRIIPAGLPRETVRVKATLDRACDGIDVHFRSVDIDDPTATGNPLDGTPDAGPTAGNDNRGGAGALAAASAATDAAGVARVTLTLPRQPGDNLKVAASTKPAFPAAVTVDGIRLMGDGVELLPAAGPNHPRDGRATRALVVWRELHIERDSMGVIPANRASGSITNSAVAGGNTVVTVNRTLEVNRFQNGKLHVNAAAHPGLIASNTASTITVGPPAVGVSDFCRLTGLFCPSFRAHDDDDLGSNDGATPDGDEGEDVGEPPLNFLQSDDDVNCGDGGCNGYARAFIRPVRDLAGENGDVPFVLNETGGGAANLTPTYRFANIASEEDALFWTVYLLGAYQHVLAQDGDPDTESRVFGIVDAISGVGANDFLEVGRECRVSATCNPILKAQMEAGTAVHEVAHLLGCRHCFDADINSCATATGGPDIMARFRAGAIAGFNQDNLDRMRDTIAP